MLNMNTLNWVYLMECFICCIGKDSTVKCNPPYIFNISSYMYDILTVTLLDICTAALNGENIFINIICSIFSILHFKVVVFVAIFSILTDDETLQNSGQ